MSCQSQEDHYIKPIKRNTKNFIYKSKKYPVSFDSIKINSNYFYDNSENFKDENIELHLEIDIEEDTINSFIDCCENKAFKVNDSNVFHLDYLSKKYDVPELSKLTKEYLYNSNTNLAFQSLLFKYQFQKNKNSISDDELQNFDTSNEEDIIGHRLNEYLNDERLLDLPIPVIDRILKKYLIENNDQNIIEFLFKCLDKHKRKASVLFLNIKMENQSNNLIIRLINDYSDIFDFNMVNLRSILNTSSELLKELTKIKIEFTQKISEMNQIIVEQKNEIKQFNEARNLIDNDFKGLISKQKQIIEEHKEEISEIKKSIENDFKNSIQKQNQTIEEQNNKIIETRKLIDNDLKNFIEKQNRINEEQKKLINELQNEIKNQKDLLVTKQIQIKNKFIKF